MTTKGYQLQFTPLTPLHKLPTNLTTGQHPVHRWYNFIAGFSPEFVAKCIDAQRQEGLFDDVVLLDPFAGCGTSLVEANLHNVASIGYEPHPFFADIARAKLEFPTDTHVSDVIERVALGAVEQPRAPEHIWGSDALAFLAKMIPEKELPVFASAAELEQDVPTSLRLVYRMLISQVLELSCVSQTDGIYKAPTTRKSARPYEVALQQVMTAFRSDIQLVGGTWTNRARLVTHTAENMSELDQNSCTMCVTSPPYLNNFDFAEMTRMELYFWRYASNWREITEKVPRNLVVNTTTAPTDLKRAQDSFRGLLPNIILPQLNELVSDLVERRKGRAGKKDYYQLVLPYFAQVTKVLHETFRVLREGGRLYLVVADSALYGVHVETQVILGKLINCVGFRNVVIRSLRVLR